MDQVALVDRFGAIIKFAGDKLRAEEGPEYAALVVGGLELVVELFLDVKRIADATETRSIDGERLARFLAKKDFDRRQQRKGEAPAPPEERSAWVDGNWRAFLDEAAELLAAALPGAGK